MRCSRSSDEAARWASPVTADRALLTLILGGASSGKSRHAQRLAEASGLAVGVIATGQTRDAAMAARRPDRVPAATPPA